MGHKSLQAFLAALCHRVRCAYHGARWFLRDIPFLRLLIGSKAGEVIEFIGLELPHHVPQPIASSSVPRISVGRRLSNRIDSTGRFLIDSQFETIEDFSEGFAAVWKAPNRRLDGRVMYVFGGKWGFIRDDASLATDIEFDRVKKFTEGVAAANFGIRYDRRGGIVDEGKWGFIDTTGKIVIPPKFDAVKPFYSGVAVYWDARLLKNGLIDHSGSVIIAAHYRQIGPYSDDDPFHDGLARAVVNDRLVEFLKPSGAVAFQCPRESCSDFSEELAHLSDGRRSGYIDTTGTIVITLDFDDARDFSEDLAAAKEQLWGYINKTGRWVIPPRFAEAHPFVDGLALARLADRWVYIDPAGGVVRDNVWDGAN
jgi:WG containing repeat